MKRLSEKWQRLCAWIYPRRRPLSFLLIYAAIVLRYLSCGGAYCWQHDDYIQYINFPSVDNYVQLLLEQGLLASRPLAAVTDLYVWSNFARCMIVGVLLLSALYAGSAMLWQSVFRRRFGTGWIFTVVYTLLPLGFEGTYWMSAGTRLICGLFLGALALWLLMRFVEDGKALCGWLYFPVLLLSYGYYEQTLVLSMAASLLLMLSYLGERRPRGLLALLTFAAAAVYFAFTAAFSDGGVISSRMELALPNNAYYFQVFLPEISGQVWHAFAYGGAGTTIRGFWRGVKLIFTEGKWLWLLACLGLTALHGLLARSDDTAEAAALPARTWGQGRRRGWAIAEAYLFGILMALAPVSIFFFIGNPWFSIRNTLPSFVGLAFLADLTVRLCLRRRVQVRAGICTGLAVLCCVASVAEMHDYRQTYQHDVVLLDRIAEKVEAEGGTISGRIGIVGVNASYLDEQNYSFNGHVTGIGSSDWELYAAISARLGRELGVDIVPLAVDEFSFWRGWNRATKRIDGFAQLWYWDEETHTLHDLAAQVQPDGSTRLTFAESGDFCAVVWEEQEDTGEYFGYIRFSE